MPTCSPHWADSSSIWTPAILSRHRWHTFAWMNRDQQDFARCASAARKCLLVRVTAFEYNQGCQVVLLSRDSIKTRMFNQTPALNILLYLRRSHLRRRRRRISAITSPLPALQRRPVFMSHTLDPTTGRAVLSTLLTLYESSTGPNVDKWRQTDVNALKVVGLYGQP